MATKKVVSTSNVSAADKKWQAQDDLRTIQRASEIQADKRRMTAAQKRQITRWPL